ncbi:hypothetical protein B0A48_18658 [Cryoendolithus antarcticus]|uniref:DUF1275 domain protein n=1 Tax=Cryoendolithus antarcticus TaxID=1507870 RepID=A0A1V8S804_9PEZI|nr:hypothetical protein B0A48_18658 [Cryoendolithus antarcticus]
MKIPWSKGYFSQSLCVDHLIELQLLVLSFSIGVQDAIAFPDFHCFASNQTGNSVVLAIGVAGLSADQFSLANIGISLSNFLLGAILTGQIANVVGPRRRGWLLFSHFIQTILVFGAAIVQSLDHDSGTGPHAMGAIALLALSSGAQVASMRPMRVPEITTAMATAAWVDFVIDPKLLAVSNAPRDRRAMFLLTLIGGSFAGAFMYKGVGSSNTLLLSAAGKLLVTVSLLVNQGEEANNSSVIKSSPDRPLGSLDVAREPV